MWIEFDDTLINTDFVKRIKIDSWCKKINDQIICRDVIEIHFYDVNNEDYSPFNYDHTKYEKVLFEFFDTEEEAEIRYKQLKEILGVK